MFFMSEIMVNNWIDSCEHARFTKTVMAFYYDCVCVAQADGGAAGGRVWRKAEGLEGEKRPGN